MAGLGEKAMRERTNSPDVAHRDGVAVGIAAHDPALDLLFDLSTSFATCYSNFSDGLAEAFRERVLLLVPDDTNPNEFSRELRKVALTGGQAGKFSFEKEDDTRESDISSFDITFAFIGVIEVLLRSGLTQEQLTDFLSWLEPESEIAKGAFDDAKKFLGLIGPTPRSRAAAQESGFVFFSGIEQEDLEPARKLMTGALRTGDDHLKGVNFSSLSVGADSWLISHNCSSDLEVFFNGLRWNPQLVMWFNPGDSIVIRGAYAADDIRLSSDSVAQLNSIIRYPNRRFFLSNARNELLIKEMPFNVENNEQLVELTYQKGIKIKPFRVDVPVYVNDKRRYEEQYLVPSDIIGIGEFRAPVKQILDRISQGSAMKRDNSFSVELDSAIIAFAGGKTGLNDVSLRFGSGELVGIIGPSGCGKSTLLSALTSDARLTSGTLTMRPSEASLGFVPQDDILYESLSVKENLYFTARLRKPGVSSKAITESVEKALERVGLLPQADLKVGGLSEKTLSGGQRKRLNIALELMDKPAALFLDEPTSGLSSSDALSIVNVLRGEADDGKLVVAVLHQPSQEIFDKFDKLVVLDVGGRLAFYGNVEDAMGYFEPFEVKSSSNALTEPDRILATMLASRCPLNPRDPKAGFAPRSLKYRSDLPEGGGSPDSEPGETRRYTPEFWHYCFQAKKDNYNPVAFRFEPLAKSPSFVAESRKTFKDKLGRWLEKAATVTAREWRRKLKTWQSVAAALGITLFLSFLIAHVCKYRGGGVDYSFERNISLPAFCYLAVVLVQFLTLSLSVNELVDDRPLRWRERLISIAALAWVFAKFSFLSLMSVLISFVIVATGWFHLGIPFYYGFGDAWATITLVALSGVGIGLAISSIPAITPRIAQAAVPLALVPQLVFAGALPFQFSQISHLRLSTNEPQKSEGVVSEADTGKTPDYRLAPEVSRVMPSRWGFQSMLASLRDAHPDKISSDRQSGRLNEMLDFLEDKVDLEGEEKESRFVEQFGDGAIEEYRELLKLDYRTSTGFDLFRDDLEVFASSERPVIVWEEIDRDLLNREQNLAMTSLRLGFFGEKERVFEGHRIRGWRSLMFLALGGLLVSVVFVSIAVLRRQRILSVKAYKASDAGNDRKLETSHTDWRWGVLSVESIPCLCYHRHLGENEIDAEYDPSEPLIQMDKT